MLWFGAKKNNVNALRYGVVEFGCL